MLILAGVSINAIVGENGVLSRAQYTSFMSEMAAVEEAVQLWKAGELMESKGQSNTAIPTKGLWERENITKNNMTVEEKRLIGEMGYYRQWSKKGMPTNNILSQDNNLFDAYGGDFIGYPAGVQDVYYLDNEALDLDKDKKYLIDAATSIIYSTTGISLNGVRCYSTHMVKAVMGNNVAPVFAEAEMSGDGENIIYAGATYLQDKNGNYIDENGNIVSEENKVLNPHGFKIIANPYSNNIYKLYNNGDLYGKGKKGISLSTPKDQMEEINAYKWNTFVVPESIPGAKTNDVTIIPGNDTIYVIDNEKNVWAWGDNTYNKLGLTQEEQVEYTGRTPIKLNIDGKKVKNVCLGQSNATFIITEDEDVYVAGYNAVGNLGVGTQTQELLGFTKIELEKRDVDIKKILSSIYGSLIWYEDNTFYYAGQNTTGLLGKGTSGEYYTTFTQIWNEEFGLDIDSEIEDVLIGGSCMILFKDGTIKQAGSTGNSGYGSGGDSLVEGNYTTFRNFDGDFATNVTNIYGGLSWRIIRRINSNGDVEFWGSPGRDNVIGLPEETYNSTKFFKIPIPDELQTDGIKEVFTTTYNVYYLSNSGKVYASGNISKTGTNIKSGTFKEITYIGLDNIKTLYSTDVVKITTNSSAAENIILFTGNDNKMYNTGNSVILFGDSVLQQNWTKIADKVKYMDANGTTFAYVSNDNNLYICGTDSTLLGLGDETINDIGQLFLHPNVNLQGKVDKVYVTDYITYLLTTDGKLYGTGYSYSNGMDCRPGWNSTENEMFFVEILDNVQYFAASQNIDSRIAFLKDGTVYGWGRNMNGMNGNSKASGSIPVAYELLTDIGGVENVLQLKTYNYYRSCLVTNDGKLFMSGNSTVNNAYDGGHIAKSYWNRYTYNLTLNDTEKIIQAAPLNQSNMLVLTDKGRVFGWGAYCYLGLNNTSTVFVETQELGIDNVSQIVAGPNWYIAIKNDGTVWGTGKNTYGILGRWIGIDRNSPNSRYKTAFEWVECPELEI